jgi:hypothetical protein
MPRDIPRLMTVPEDLRDVDWLKEALQAAIDLEHATLPVYLCGMWSIIEQSGEVYSAIQRVVLQEMVHMGLACNMLTTIGESPEINTLDAVPKYPGPLPGNVRPQLTVYLASLSKEVLEHVYLQIEYPESGPIAMMRGLAYPTIGAFYDAVLARFQKLSPSDITGQNQVESTIGDDRVFAITDVSDAEKAIELIQVQGEGTSISPLQEDFDPSELAHYYVFAEILHGHKLIRKDGVWVYEGDPIPFPEVFPMAQVPQGGYPEVSKDFDKLYTTLLNQLHDIWNGNPRALGAAIGTMFQLAALRHHLGRV